MRLPEFTAAAALGTTTKPIRDSYSSSPVVAPGAVALQSVGPAVHSICPPHDYHCYCMVNDGIWVCQSNGRCHCIYI
jgi:hypothetical protein